MAYPRFDDDEFYSIRPSPRYTPPAVEGYEFYSNFTREPIVAAEGKPNGPWTKELLLTYLNNKMPEREWIVEPFFPDGQGEPFAGRGRFKIAWATYYKLPGRTD